MLRNFCNEAHLYYDNFYKTALIKDEAGGKDEDQLKALVSQYSSILLEEIKSLDPNLLIPLGELSFNFLTGLSGIRKFRGSCLLADANLNLGKPKKVLPILGPHPYLNQEYRLRFVSRVDFTKIHKYLNSDLPTENKLNIWVAKSSAALRAFIERSYPTAEFLTFDIETFKGIPSCISFCFNGVESVCIPLLDQSIDLDNRVLMMGLVAKLLASPIPKVNQNIKFDWKILERWNFKVANVVGDTMLASSVIYCEFPSNLGFLTSIYTDIPYFKDEGREFDPAKHKKEQFYLYNAKDSLAVHQIYPRQLDEMSEQGVKPVYDKLIQLMPIYRKMEDRGIRIDDEQRKRLLAKYESLFHIEELKQKRLLNIDYFNPLSWKQCDEVIFNVLKFKKTRGVKGTDEESLLLLQAYSESEYAPITGKQVLASITAARKIHKVIEILELPEYPDKRFRCEYNLAGTETGRTSAGESLDEVIMMDNKKKPLVLKLGHSLQTIGKHGFYIDGELYGTDIRSMFVPSRGYRFVECDLSQAEARVDTILAGNFDLLKVFDGPVGIHRLTGSWVYACDPTEIKKGTIQYHMSKTVRHAGERNMRADRMFAMTQRPLNECQRILDTFHKFQPEIRGVFHRDIIAAINANHLLVAPNGRRRDFFDRVDNHTYNEAISFLPQAIVTDLTKFSFIPTFEACPWARLLAEAHDGSLAEVPIGREEQYIVEYKKNVEVPVDFRKCTLARDFELIIPCEASVGENWQDMEDFKLG